MSEPTLAEMLAKWREEGNDPLNNGGSWKGGRRESADELSAFHARAKALAEKWEARAGHWRKEDDSVALAAAATQCEICAAELRNLTGDLQP